ncbi:tricarboxylate transport protein TctB [Geomicrobium sp. JCM 19037]|uniref:tripartite tricarboxylate transporter TctB family protein n=1 Tax=Geomicrobium sp. JCM 19037 TaxID=1460634 RepID=UPI00045F3282|nr:tripartite tricarboxylate transporter TctB family protein [Geomicrobium sp. JCM 19037]GAK03050.1 tricarboxylate transport protein TctB [Geomicrobium sp. JCM 19037]
MTKKDRWIGLGVLGVGIYMILETLTMNYMNLMDDPGPVLLPRVVGSALALCGAGLVIGGIKATPKEEKTPEKKAMERKMFTVFGALVVYAVAFPILGYLLSTFLFLVGTMLYLANKRTGAHTIKVGVASAALTFALYWIFTEYLDVILPSGWFV